MQWNATFALSHSKKLELAQETSDGAYVVAGNMGTSVLSGTNTPTGWVFCLMKCDANLNMLWNKTYNSGQEAHLYYLQQTADRGFILAGHRWSWSNNADESGVWLVKIDQNGFAEWNKTYGEITSAYLDSISKTSDEGCIMVSPTQEGILLMKVNSLGSLEWTRTVRFPSAL
jgi:hypothetical protein